MVCESLVEANYLVFYGFGMLKLLFFYGDIYLMIESLGQLSELSRQKFLYLSEVAVVLFGGNEKLTRSRALVQMIVEASTTTGIKGRVAVAKDAS